MRSPLAGVDRSQGIITTGRDLERKGATIAREMTLGKRSLVTTTTTTTVRETWATEAWTPHHHRVRDVGVAGKEVVSKEDDLKNVLLFPQLPGKLARRLIGKSSRGLFLYYICCFYKPAP